MTFQKFRADLIASLAPLGERVHTSPRIASANNSNLVGRSRQYLRQAERRLASKKHVCCDKQNCGWRDISCETERTGTTLAHRQQAGNILIVVAAWKNLHARLQGVEWVRIGKNTRAKEPRRAKAQSLPTSPCGFCEVCRCINRNYDQPRCLSKSLAARPSSKSHMTITLGRLRTWMNFPNPAEP